MYNAIKLKLGTPGKVFHFQNVTTGTALMKYLKKYNMKMNIKRTKITRSSRQENHNVRISIDGQQVEETNQFKYLGSVISADGYCGTEIRRKIALGKQAFINKKMFS